MNTKKEKINNCLKLSKWTIGIVNYNSSVYIKWQLKILYEANSENDFQLIIVDNSKDDGEFNNLEELCKNYDNIKLIQHSPKCETASGQHGEGLDIIRKLANSKYFIAQDPDFFWLKKDYLKWLEALLQYNDAVGVPYHGKVLGGQEYFPSAFGCAYIYDKIKKISFKPYVDDINSSLKKHDNVVKSQKGCYDFSYDVGWRTRKALSKNTDYNFISFNQLRLDEDIFNKFIHNSNKNSHSFDFCSTIYSHNGNVVALHLFRGTFTGEVINLKDPKKHLNCELINTRNKIAKFMYDEISSNNINLNLLYNATLNNSQKYNKFFKKTKGGNSNLWSFLLFIKKIKYFKVMVPIKASYIKNKIAGES
jgi:hypothetical protein